MTLCYISKAVEGQSGALGCESYVGYVSQYQKMHTDLFYTYRGDFSVACYVQILQLWYGFAVSLLWRATVLHCDSEWFHTACLTLVAIKEYGWDGLPISGAQTLPLQTGTYLALERWSIGSALWEWSGSQGSYVCVFVECSNGLSQWYIEACSVVHKCVLCDADCAGKWWNIFRYWGLCLYLCCVMWVRVLYCQYGSCTEKLMDHFVPDHIWILVLIVHTLAMLSPDLLPSLCFCLFDASNCGLCWTSWPLPFCARADHATENCSYHKREDLSPNVFSVLL